MKIFNLNHKLNKKVRLSMITIKKSKKELLVEQDSILKPIMNFKILLSSKEIKLSKKSNRKI